MKKLAGCLCCLVFLYVSQVHAQVPAVLGVWEFDKQASTLPEDFLLAFEIRSYDLRDDGYLVNIVWGQTSRPRFFDLNFCVVSPGDHNWPPSVATKASPNNSSLLCTVRRTADRPSV